jgi:hypothetical protein
MKKSNCKQRRYNDEIYCSCGLFWDVKEPDPHPIEPPTETQNHIKPEPVPTQQVEESNFVSPEKAQEYIDRIKKMLNE